MKKMSDDVVALLAACQAQATALLHSWLLLWVGVWKSSPVAAVCIMVSSNWLVLCVAALVLRSVGVVGKRAVKRP
jgi:hypothetical protein